MNAQAVLRIWLGPQNDVWGYKGSYVPANLNKVTEWKCIVLCLFINKKMFFLNQYMQIFLFDQDLFPDNYTVHL